MSAQPSLFDDIDTPAAPADDRPRARILVLLVLRADESLTPHAKPGRHVRAPFRALPDADSPMPVVVDDDVPWDERHVARFVWPDEVNA